MIGYYSCVCVVEFGRPKLSITIHWFQGKATYVYLLWETEEERIDGETSPACNDTYHSSCACRQAIFGTIPRAKTL